VSPVALLCLPYLAGLAVWLLTWKLVGDGLRPLFFVNSLGHLFFLPAPLVLVLSILDGGTALIVASASATGGFAIFWLLPQLRRALPATAPANPRVLRVATYNMLWVNQDSQAAISAIRSLDADVVALQEVSPAHSSAIESELCADYPYRLLEPRERAYGNGLISRLPMERSPAIIQDPDWIGPPVIASLRFELQEVTFVACHAAPIRTEAQARERQAQVLVRFASEMEPCVILGDFNSSPTNIAYRILARSLQDVWRAAGKGMGHTFPGRAWSRASGDGLPRPLRRFVPPWVLRIDHIFITRDLRAVAARIGPEAGGSDHRPVVVDLALKHGRPGAAHRWFST
jgi:endonuclease/exonuclease/phosphatase (EEP) superfamily protein YafD